MVADQQAGAPAKRVGAAGRQGPTTVAPQTPPAIPSPPSNPRNRLEKFPMSPLPSIGRAEQIRGRL
jgi:hypothetical protein